MAITVVIWSVNYTVGKIGFHYMRPMALASFRVLVAGVAMLPVAIWCAAKQRRQNAAGESTRLKRIEPGDLWNFACLGFFGVFLNQGLFTVGLSMTSVGRSAIVVATTPIFILLAAWTQRMERLTTRKVLGLAAAFAGAVVLGAGRDWNLRSTGSQGDLLTFVACLSVVIFTVLGKRMATSVRCAAIDGLQCRVCRIVCAAHRGLAGVGHDTGRGMERHRLARLGGGRLHGSAVFGAVHPAVPSGCCAGCLLPRLVR